MFRFWVKEIKDNRLLRDVTITDETDDTRTHKIMNSLAKACADFDLPIPIWLNNNVTEFKRHSKTRFYKDSFIETIPFDYLEIQILEE